MNHWVIRLLTEIDEFKGLWHGSGGLPQEVLESMKRFATIESIGSSTRIEGAKLTDREVENLLQGIETQSFRTRDEQEVAGYAETIRLVYDHWPDMPITENTIKSLHKQLLQFSDKDEWHFGQYKRHPNHVAAFDADGRQIGIVFETVSPYDTPVAMESLIRLYEEQLKMRESHPLLMISEFIVRFLAIHPFQDGNGRLARILTILLLLKAGYEYVPYSSLERSVEANKEEYYRALRASQITLHEETPNLEPWILFFLDMLKKQKDHLDEVWRTHKSRDQMLPASEAILSLLRTSARVTLREAQAASGINRNTLKAHFRQLVVDGKILQHGKGRGTYYTLT